MKEKMCQAIKCYNIPEEGSIYCAKHLQLAGKKEIMMIERSVTEKTILRPELGRLLKRRFTILLPVDGSKASFKAIEYTTRIAKLTNSNIIFLHIIASHGYLFGHGRRSILAKYNNEARRGAQRWLDEVTSRTKKEGIDASSDIVSGSTSVVNSIVDYADKHNVDLIVISSRRKGRFKFLVGSVANAVVSRASCSVLLVK